MNKPKKENHNIRLVIIALYKDVFFFIKAMKANKEYMIGKNYVRSYFSFSEKRRREGKRR
jgi:hypothetical protein